ncbi:MAG TPA: FtsX-like permease family protein, partial [Candidatus Cloacimonadota bacterium]|nr:FtsX-like permease family protein [Candidatus Cloacimonadota bacterium]
TLMSSTVFGAMTLRNFVISGTVEFGASSLDRGALVADLQDIREMLDMQDAAGEILAYFKNGEYNVRAATEVMNGFNERYSKATDEFSPQMLRLNDQGNMGPILKMFDYSKLWMSIGFIFVLSIVLWNAGLLNGIRRYGEFGLRLAIGESKSQVYLALTAEAAIVGIVGGLLGILLGLAISLYFNNIGMDMSAYTRSSAMMTENTLYTTITTQAIILSFLPGFVSTIFGAALAGLAIFKRETSQLTKELET